MRSKKEDAQKRKKESNPSHVRRLERPKDGFETFAGRRTKTGEQTAKTTTRRKRDTHSDMMILLLLLLLLSSGTITRPYVLVRDDDVALDSVFFCVDWRTFVS